MFENFGVNIKRHSLFLSQAKLSCVFILYKFKIFSLFTSTSCKLLIFLEIAVDCLSLLSTERKSLLFTFPFVIKVFCVDVKSFD